MMTLFETESDQAAAADKPIWIYGMYAMEPPWGPPVGPCHVCRKKGWPGMDWRWTGGQWECILSLTGGHEHMNRH
jgi:hypothetical protein